MDSESALGPTQLTLESPLNDEAQKAVSEFAHQIEPGLEAVRFEGSRLVLVTRNTRAVTAEAARRILAYASEQLATGDQISERIVRERQRGRYQNHDLDAELLRSGDVLEEGPGLYAMQGNFLACKLALDGALRERALQDGAVEQEYPPLLELRTLLRSGYVGNFPQHLFFVSELERGIAATDRAQAATQSDLTELLPCVQPAGLAVSPTVCYHCFRAHQDRRLAQFDYAVTAIGKCGRREAFHRGLERLQVFTMREVVLFGSQDRVEQQRGKWVDAIWSLVDLLDLTARVMVAFDPFFAGNRKKVYQAMLESKHELQLWLPQHQRWCAVASFNHHSATLVRSFGIAADGSAELNSGCFGLGYERFIYGFLSQAGLQAGRELHSAGERWRTQA